jgi:hypothetical protein
MGDAKGWRPMSVTVCRRLMINGARAPLAGVILLVAFAAHAQSTAPAPLGIAPGTPPAESAPAPEAAPSPPPKPGLFGAIGRWMDDSIGNVRSGWSSTRDAVGGLGNRAGDAAKGAAGAARDAAGAARDAAAAAAGAITPGSLVTGRQHCIRAANGGPDCEAASEVLCRTKGFTTGSSLHIQSEQKCPVWGWINGEKPVGKCNTETYVTRVMCR